MSYDIKKLTAAVAAKLTKRGHALKALSYAAEQELEDTLAWMQMAANRGKVNIVSLDVWPQICDYSYADEKGWSAKMEISCTLEAVQSWSRLTSFLEAFADARSDMDGEWESWDHPASYSRVYELKYPSQESDTTFHISITASLPGDTETCKRVIVGYTEPEMRKAEPIYKLQCEEPK